MNNNNNNNNKSCSSGYVDPAHPVRRLPLRLVNGAIPLRASVRSQKQVKLVPGSEMLFAPNMVSPLLSLTK